MLTKRDDPSHKQKAIYSLTEKGDRNGADHGASRRLGPQMAGCQRGIVHSRRALEEGGPQMWEEFMQELRHEQLGEGAKPNSVRAVLQAAYLEVMARKRREPAVGSPT
jgi:hypothetical protein